MGALEQFRSAHIERRKRFGLQVSTPVVPAKMFPVKRLRGVRRREVAAPVIDTRPLKRSKASLDLVYAAVALATMQDSAKILRGGGPKSRTRAIHLARYVAYHLINGCSFPWIGGHIDCSHGSVWKSVIAVQDSTAAFAIALDRVAVLIGHDPRDYAGRAIPSNVLLDRSPSCPKP